MAFRLFGFHPLPVVLQLHAAKFHFKFVPLCDVCTHGLDKCSFLSVACVLTYEKDLYVLITYY